MKKVNGDINKIGLSADDGEEKRILHSRQRQQTKRTEKAETKKESISQRMRQLEMKVLKFGQPAKEKEPFCQEMLKPIKLSSVNHNKRKEAENPKKLAHKKRRVELERERRKGLTQLFEELDYWLEMGEK